MMSSNSVKRKGSKGSDSEGEDANSDSEASKTRDDKQQPRKIGRKTSLAAARFPSSISVTTAITTSPAARQSTAQSSILPSLAEAAAAATPVAPRSEKKPRRAGFGEQFLQKVRAIRAEKLQHICACLIMSLTFFVCCSSQLDAVTIDA